MRILIVLLIAASIFMAGCSNVRTYTFQKDRVDQKAEGNRGYLMGTPPPAPAEREVPKRTLFGLDIEIPILPGEKAPASSDEAMVYEEDIVVIEEEYEVQERTNFEPKPKPDGKVDVDEDEWVK